MAMKKFYKGLCKVEEFIVMVFLATITGLVFISAVTRTLKHPVNWAEDLSLLMFAWLVFLSADMAMRKADFVSVDILVDRLPGKARKILYYVCSVLIVLFLGVLIVYSIPLCIDNSKRLFQTLRISYSWATASIPVGALLLGTTAVKRIISNIKADCAKREEIVS